jgi:hypothetical protein
MRSDRHSILGAWLIVFIGIVLLTFGFVMYFVFDIGLIWIGGLILGVGVIVAGLKMLKEISIEHHPPKKYYPKTDSDYITINCGNCSYQYHEKRVRGLLLPNALVVAGSLKY